MSNASAWWRGAALTSFFIGGLCGAESKGQSTPWQQPPQGAAAAAPNTSSHPNPPEYPNQPVQPQLPTLERREPAPAAAAWQLPPQEQAEVDRVLQLWEQRSASIKTFECKFKRWTYDFVWGPKDKPQFEDLGIVKYAAPDKGLFRLDKSVVDGKETALDPSRGQHWVCDGQSIYDYHYPTKRVHQTPIPPELQGKAIAQSPLPFLFGSTAEDLRRRYFIRIVTPREELGKQTWLHALPRYQQDARNFREAIFVLSNRDMQPQMLQIVDPSGKQKASYYFFDVVLNDPFGFFKGDPFRISMPDREWQLVLDPAAQPPSTAPGQSMPQVGRAPQPTAR
ncbi:MAG: TIGR03009 domain-containing protein [Planctomycetota bacterium]